MIARKQTRQEKTQDTRSRMLQAARRLFAQRGYAATPMTLIAEKAGVAVQTIYFTFGNKHEILAELLDISVAGDEEPVPTLERPWAKAVIEEPDPHVQLRLQTAGAREIYERAVDVLEVLRNAATSDPRMMHLWRLNCEQRRAVQARFIEALGEKAAVRPSVAKAVDIAFVVLGPESYQNLVATCRWTPAEWAEFAYRTLDAQLLGYGQRGNGCDITR